MQGNETRKEKDTQTYSAICRINHFESEKGDVYIKSNMLGYYRIIRNHGEVVYSMPVFDYLVLVTMILAFLSVFAFVFILVLKNLVTIQNDKKLYTCTKEILKHRIEGLQMKKV